MTEWVRVSDQVKELREETWSTYWSEMKAAEDIEFLKDPKKALLEAGLIEEDYRIQTQIVNADVPTAGDDVCKLLLVFPEEKLALITSYRHPR